MGARSEGKDSSSTDRKGQIRGLKKTFNLKATQVNTPLQTNATLIQRTMRATRTQNQFNIGEQSLSDFDEMDVEEILKQNKSKPKQRNPPVIIANSTVSDVQNICNQVVTSKKFEVKLLRIGIRVNITEKSEFDALSKVLTEKKFNFFTYQLPTQSLAK